MNMNIITLLLLVLLAACSTGELSAEEPEEGSPDWKAEQLAIAGDLDIGDGWGGEPQDLGMLKQPFDYFQTYGFQPAEDLHRCFGPYGTDPAADTCYIPPERGLYVIIDGTFSTAERTALRTATEAVMVSINNHLVNPWQFSATSTALTGDVCEQLKSSSFPNENCLQITRTTTSASPGQRYQWGHFINQDCSLTGSEIEQEFDIPTHFYFCQRAVAQFAFNAYTTWKGISTTQNTAGLRAAIGHMLLPAIGLGSREHSGSYTMSSGHVWKTFGTNETLLVNEACYLDWYTCTSGSFGSGTKGCGLGPVGSRLDFSSVPCP
jgi:hypothetical protein